MNQIDGDLKGSATIVLRRVAMGPRDMASKYSVLIDAVKRGSLRPGQQLIVQVQPGAHVVRIETGLRYRSDELEMVLGNHESLTFECSPRPIRTYFKDMFRRTPWIDLEVID